MANLFFALGLVAVVSLEALEQGGPTEVVDVRWWKADRRLSDQTKEQSMPEEIDVKFAAHKKQFHLRLRRNRILITGDARHLVHHPDGRIEEGPMPQACFYQGEVLGDASGRVSMSTCDGQFSGLILADDGALVVEPARGRALAEGEILANGARHRVKIMDDDNFKDFVGDVQEFTSIPISNASRGRMLSTPTKKYVEVVVVNDASRYSGFGGESGLTKLATHSVEVMNTVTTIYNRAPKAGSWPYKIQVVLVGMHTIKSGDPWENTVKKLGSETDCSSLLDLFNQWGATQQSAGLLTAADNRVLLSGRDFDGSTVGLAGMSVMCRASRSGNVNMCAHSDNQAGCAATVAHEMGHNFGMNHDGGGVNRDCSKSGQIMESVGNNVPSEEFSECSVKNIQNFFTNAYDDNGACLENVPTKVFGDPVCKNGFVEEGEQCDCGAADCSTLDPCCNGETCQFKQASYQCSDATGACCENCMFVPAGAKVCRAAKNACDLPETCAGGTHECPRDVFVYPGQSCTRFHGGKMYSGLCSAGQCMSLDYTCSVEINSDFEDDWDLTETCAAFNDQCGNIVCHKKQESLPYKCGQSFSTHGKQMVVPEGTPCWYPGDPKGTRSGMCILGTCQQEFALAVVPLCGNGGIDFGEQCDCGNGGDIGCCDCSTCKLKQGKQCSALDDCCNAATCQFKPAGTECRAAASSCDVAEVCTGSSSVCPSDKGNDWGTACTESGVASICYGKMCVKNMDAQCKAVTSGDYPVSFRTQDSKGDRNAAPEHSCDALACSPDCELCGKGYTCAGDWFCSGISKSSRSSTFSISDSNGNEIESNTIQLMGAVDGTVLSGAYTNKVCLSGKPVDAHKTGKSCTSSEFFENSVGRCLACSTACTTCHGPTNFDCVGHCKYGCRDARGACAISAEQLSFSTMSATEQCPDPPKTQATTKAASTAAPTQATTKVEVTTKAASNAAPPTTTSAPSVTTTAEIKQVVVGKTTLVLDKVPADFDTNPVVKESLQEAIAGTLQGVNKEDVVILKVTTAGARRLLHNIKASPRRLADNVEVDFQINVPPTYKGVTITAVTISSAKLKENINTAFTAKGITVKVESVKVKSMKTVTGGGTTTQEGSASKATASSHPDHVCFLAVVSTFASFAMLWA